MSATSGSGYLVLARKWRPQRFEDLLGQSHVARTLTTAIQRGRVHHAFLFTGVRGVGKTSAARILARALNCQDGPVPQPCGVCDACTSIAAGSATDVQEIDGASNNSVEDIRRLRENVAYQPSALRFKIYIIDEAHMLSQSAFNALLKTLEEPPPHVKFIFATTEPHKILATIRSRCQQYEFRRIGSRAIAGRLQEILEAEGLKLRPEVARILADEAAGSMRDALSLLDQVIAAFPDGATADEVTWLLGVTPQTLIVRAARAVMARDPRGALEAAREADEAGHDLQQFARAFLRYLRELVVLSACTDVTGLTELAEADLDAAREIVRGSSAPHLQRLFLLASRLVDELARSALPRVHLDVALARMATADVLLPLADILARLEGVPGGRDGGGAPPPPRGPAGGGPGPGRLAPVETPAPSHAPPRAEPPRRAPPAPPPPDDEPPPPEDAAETEGMPATGGVEPEAPVRPAPAPAALGAPADAWERITREAAARDRPLSALLGHAVPTEISLRAVRLAFPADSTAADLLRQGSRMASLADAVERVLGTRAAVEIDDRSSEAARAVAVREAERSRADEQVKHEMVDHPAVRETLRVFAGSRVVDVKLGSAADGSREPAAPAARGDRAARPGRTRR